MCRKTVPGFVFLILALAAVFLLSSIEGYAQTQGMDRRQERRDDRQEVRDTRQTGRKGAREVKADCREGDESRADCRQEKRDTKQDARQEGRNIRKND